MEKIEKTIYYNNLLHTYGELLSSTQKEILVAYFNYDLSLSEIANMRHISRAAVEDALQKGTNKLIEIENKVKYVENKEEILQILAKLKENPSNSQIFRQINEIERRLK